MESDSDERGDREEAPLKSLPTVHVGRSGIYANRTQEFSGHENNVGEKKIFVFLPSLKALEAFCIFEIVTFHSSNNRHLMATDFCTLSLYF